MKPISRDGRKSLPEPRLALGDSERTPPFDNGARGRGGCAQPEAAMDRSDAVLDQGHL